MKTRVIVSLVLLPIFFLVLFVLPPIFLSVLISVICGIAAFELLRATKLSKNISLLIFTITAAALVPLAVYLSAVAGSIAAADGTGTERHPYATLFLFTLIFSILFIFLSLLLIEAFLTMKNQKAIDRGKQLKFRQIPIPLAAGILVPCMLSSLIGLKTLNYGHLFVLLPIVAAFVTDSGAYFTGVTIGKRKAFPTISPNKTVEGYIGGTIAGIIGMLIFGIIISSATSLTVIYPVLILYGIVGAVVTEAGDLIFSLIKRKCEIKDYGNLIPGHGGALDRFDSMIFCAPSMYILMITIPVAV